MIATDGVQTIANAPGAKRQTAEFTCKPTGHDPVKHLSRLMPPNEGRTAQERMSDITETYPPRAWFGGHDANEIAAEQRQRDEEHRGDDRAHRATEYPEQGTRATQALITQPLYDWGADESFNPERRS